MKIRSVVALLGLTIGLAAPTFSQDKNTIDPEVRQQIEAALTNFDEAYNKHDAATVAALFTLDATQGWAWETAGGVAFGQEAIKKRYEAELAATPANKTRKLLQVYPIGGEICAISRASMGGDPWDCVTIYVRELDEWKIRMEYSKMHEMTESIGH
jgi:ketosteroid isomerase-like protein